MTIELAQTIWINKSGVWTFYLGSFHIASIRFCRGPNDYLISAKWAKKYFTGPQPRSQFPTYSDIEMSKKWVEEKLLLEFIKSISK